MAAYSRLSYFMSARDLEVQRMNTNPIDGCTRCHLDLGASKIRVGLR